MKKSTKIITTSVALAIVVAAMVVGIYAATQATSTITAAVSWTATQGITFTLNGSVAGGATTPAAISQTVTASTSNTTAGALAGTLSTSFKDSSSDGVNNPGAITYTYIINNTGSKAITVKLSKYPGEANESGTAGTASSHKPKVAYTITNGGTYSGGTFSGGSAVTYANAIATAGTSLAAGKAIRFQIVLSMAAGGTGTINADTGITSFDAGITFALS